MAKGKLRTRTVAGVHFRQIEVTRACDITAKMRRIEFAILPGPRPGETVATPQPPFQSGGFDDNVRLIFPDPQSEELPIPRPEGSAEYGWTEASKALTRAYTVRKWDAEENCLTIDFARHHQGVAEEWSATVAPGKRLWLAGPRTYLAFPEAIDHLIMIADPTALPAMERGAEEAPPGCQVTALCLIPDEGFINHDFQLPGLELRWLLDADPQTIESELRAAVGQSDEVIYVWAAGETNQLRELRKIVKAVGVPASHCEFTGYWRKTAGEHIPSSIEAEDVLEFLSAGAHTPMQISDALSLDLHLVEVIVEHMEELNLVSRQGDAYQLTKQAITLRQQ